MKHFVKYNLNEDIWMSYEALYAICHTSRYKNYIVEKEELALAREALEIIQSFCIENQK